MSEEVIPEKVVPDKPKEENIVKKDILDREILIIEITPKKTLRKDLMIRSREYNEGAEC